MTTPIPTRQRFTREFLDSLGNERVLKLAYRQNGLARRIEDDFRIWAFHVYYDGPYADTKPCLKRFVLSLLASAAPVTCEAAETAWKADHARNLLCEKKPRRWKIKVKARTHPRIA